MRKENNMTIEQLAQDYALEKVVDYQQSLDRYSQQDPAEQAVLAEIYKEAYKEYLIKKEAYKEATTKKEE